MLSTIPRRERERQGAHCANVALFQRHQVYNKRCQNTLNSKLKLVSAALHDKLALKDALSKAQACARNVFRFHVYYRATSYDVSACGHSSVCSVAFTRGSRMT